MKEYAEERFKTESGGVERRTLGPAYFEDSPEFKKEMEAAVVATRQAVSDVFFETLMVENPDVPERERKKAKEYALQFAAIVERELRGEGHNATLALAAVEAGIGLLDFGEGARERRIEESEKDFQEAVEETREAREKRKDFERASEFLFSAHPDLTKLHTRDDHMDWLRFRVESVAQRVKKLAEKKDSASNVAVGQMANEEASLRRYLAGNHTPTDYDAIFLQIEEEKTGIRKQLAAHIMACADSIAGRAPEWISSEGERKELVRFEETLSQFYQMERMWEEERRHLRVPKIKKR